MIESVIEMARLRGIVRYRFHSDDDEIEILIEGEASWVEEKVEELGLTGVGWYTPVAVAPRATNISSVTSRKLTQGEGDDGEEQEFSPNAPPADMGPEPDPSRIPVVRRPIGELDLNHAISRLELGAYERPDPIAIMEALEDIEKPEPLHGMMSVDPEAEAWLRALMGIVVREFGASGLRTEDIEEIASTHLGGREGVELEVFLESLFSAGKLVKIHGGDAIGWGPSPKWLGGRI